MIVAAHIISNGGTNDSHITLINWDELTKLVSGQVIDDRVPDDIYVSIKDNDWHDKVMFTPQVFPKPPQTVEYLVTIYLVD